MRTIYTVPELSVAAYPCMRRIYLQHTTDLYVSAVHRCIKSAMFTSTVPFMGSAGTNCPLTLVTWITKTNYTNNCSVNRSEANGIRRKRNGLLSGLMALKISNDQLSKKLWSSHTCLKILSQIYIWDDHFWHHCLHFASLAFHLTWRRHPGKVCIEPSGPSGTSLS